jgi:hypothetical protein
MKAQNILHSTLYRFPSAIKYSKNNNTFNIHITGRSEHLYNHYYDVTKVTAELFFYNASLNIHDIFQTEGPFSYLVANFLDGQLHPTPHISQLYPQKPTYLCFNLPLVFNSNSLKLKHAFVWFNVGQHNNGYAINGGIERELIISSTNTT